MTPSSAEIRSRAQVQVLCEGRVSFAEAHARMLEDQRARADGQERGLLRLFSPSPVVTIGSGADDTSLLASRSDFARSGISVETVDRGGEATYHGPGQRVGYLTMFLEERERDLHALLREIEGALIESLLAFGITGRRVEGRTGVWVEDRKIASIGLSVRRWVTGHGFALCVAGDLEPFAMIVPCGIADCRITSIEAETGRAPSTGEVDAALSRSFSARWGGLS